MLRPMDIHNINFKRVFKGYCVDEVDDYLATIVGKYETLYQQNRKLQEELNTVRKELSGEDQEREMANLISLTKETVNELQTVAKQESENMINVAQVKADHLISEAEIKAKQMLTDAETRLAKTQWAERQLRKKIRSTMEIIWNSLVEEEESKENPEVTQVYYDMTSQDDYEDFQELEVENEPESEEYTSEYIAAEQIETRQDDQDLESDESEDPEYDSDKLETGLDFGFKDFDLTSD